jgi:hypothetical protein
VNSTTRTFALTAAAALALTLTACSATDTPTVSQSPTSTTATAGACTGVTVIVDTGDLKPSPDPAGTTCVDTTTSILGSDALKNADITTVGTTKYPDQVVCRVDGVPSETTDLPDGKGGTYHETCANMPAASAYWAVWVKPSGGKWDYAQTGLSALQLKPGDSLELLFTMNGKPASPAPTPTS